ncbi:MAG: hypothetical protein JXB07_18885 [Anaerolineae bacterium]|nr:hypothetical protein [Anaerolineae bacterium]
MPKQYIAQERVRHSVTRQYYEPGQVIPVDHVSPADLAALVDRGVLREVEVAEVAEPVKVEPVGPITPAITQPRASKKEEVKDNV